MALTPNVQLDVPAHGSNVDTWDVPVNGDFTIIDAILGSITAVSLSSSPVTLSITQAQVAVLRFSGTLTGNVTVTLPAIVKSWTVENNTTGNFVVTLTTGSGDVLGMPPGEPCEVYCSGSGLKFKNLGRTGKVEHWYAQAMPAWVTACTKRPYFECNAGTFSASDYPALNAFLGGNTLPDIRGRAIYGYDGGTSRLTGATVSPDGNTLGANGGVQTIALDVSQIPAHTHAASVTDPGHIHSLNNGANVLHNIVGGGYNGTTFGAASDITVNPATTGITVSNSNTGGGLVHNNLPPAIVMLCVIKT